MIDIHWRSLKTAAAAAAADDDDDDDDCKESSDPQARIYQRIPSLPSKLHQMLHSPLEQACRRRHKKFAATLRATYGNMNSTWIRIRLKHVHIGVNHLVI